MICPYYGHSALITYEKNTTFNIRLPRLGGVCHVSISWRWLSKCRIIAGRHSRSNCPNRYAEYDYVYNPIATVRYNKHSGTNSSTDSDGRSHTSTGCRTGANRSV